MKTQQECWQALIDGETLVHYASGNEYRIVDGMIDGPYGPIAFGRPEQWSVKPKKLPFCDALRALVAGECKEISARSVCSTSTITRDTSLRGIFESDFDHEWELIK